MYFFIIYIQIIVPRLFLFGSPYELLHLHSICTTPHTQDAAEYQHEHGGDDGDVKATDVETKSMLYFSWMGR
jgi:hypothetical protein